MSMKGYGALLGVCVVVCSGCGKGGPTPADVAFERQRPNPTAVVDTGSVDTDVPEVTGGIVAEFRGSGTLTEDEIKQHRKFNLRIVRYRQDGSRVTAQQGNATPFESADGEIYSFAHSLRVPDKPGDYFLVVTVGRRIDSELPLRIVGSKE